MRTGNLSYLLLATAVPTLGLAETSDNDGFKAGNDNSLGVGSRSMAAGWLNVPGAGSIAIGSSNTIGDLSIALGTGNTLNPLTVSSGGLGISNSIISSASTFAFGSYNVAAMQTSSFIGGFNNSVTLATGSTGEGNILLGGDNVIDGTGAGAPSLIEGTILLGLENASSSTHAWVLGRGNTGQEGTVTLGQYADPVAAAALIVGSGTGPNSRSNALVVAKNGNITVPGGILILGNEPAITGSAAENLVEGYLETYQYLRKAQGIGATASSGAVVALGAGASAVGDSSIAIGADSEALAAGSIAIGHQSAIGENGTDSLAFTGGFVNAPYSMAVGGAQTYGTFSMAMMMGMATSNFAIAIGGYDTTFGNYPANVSAGEGATTIGGVSNKAEGFSSFASGFWTKANAYNSIAIGSLNRGGGSSSTQWIETDPLLELGNGTAQRSATEPPSSARSNAITTLKNGQTTLENKYWDPDAPLQESQPGQTSENESGRQALVVKGHTKLLGKVIIDKPQGDILMGVFGEPDVEVPSASSIAAPSRMER